MSFWDFFVGGLSFFWSPLLISLVSFGALIATIVWTIGISIAVVIDGWDCSETSTKVAALLLWIFCIPLTYTSISVISYVIAHSTNSGLYWQ